MRQTKGLLDEHNEDEKFVHNLQKEATNLREINVDLRKEAVDVLVKHEQTIWVSYNQIHLQIY